VLASKFGPQRLRFVLHRDLDDSHVEQCLAACRSFAAPARSLRSMRSITMRARSIFPANAKQAAA